MKKCTLTDIPASDVKQVVGDFLSDDCVDIRAEKQDNGLWTVSALCPE